MSDLNNNPLSKSALIKTNGQFHFSWLAKTSVEILKKQFSAMLQGCLVLLVSVIACGVLLSYFFSIEEMSQLSPSQQGIIDIALILVVAPLTAGIAVMGVTAARSQQVKTLDIFNYIPLVIVLALAQLLISILVQIGLILLLLPGIYLLLATTFVLPLIADKKLGIFDAILQSCKMVNKFILSFIVLFSVFFVLFLLSLLTFGFALLFVMPLYFVTLGVIYVVLFDEENPSDMSLDKQELTFDA